MTNEENQQQDQRSSTTPPDETKDATTPPANGDVDQEAVDKGQENIEKVSGN